MKKLIECVPNFSEGRDKSKIDDIISSMNNHADITVLDGTESLAYREEDIPDSLSNPQDKDKKDDKPITNGPTPEQKEALKNFRPIKFGTDEDIQYVEALKILKGMGDQALMLKN